jgi:hypothetical protein
MIQSIIKVVLVMGIILLIGCEGGTTFTKTIHNQSSETITITVYSSYSGGQTDHMINPNESKQIYWDDQMGSFVDESYNCTQEFDSLAVTISNNKVLTKDILNPDNWLVESKDGRNSREDCTFEFDDSDLEE